MLWITLCIATPIVWATTNIIDRFVLTKLIKNPLLPTTSFCLAGAIMAALTFIIHGFTPLTTVQIFACLIAGILQIIAEFLYFKAAGREEISRVISLVYIDPLFTTILAALFLGEVFSILKYVGIVLMVLGAFAISHRPGKKFDANAALYLCLGSAFLFGASNVVNKYALTNTDFWTVFSYIRLGSFIGLLPIIFVKRAAIQKALPKKISSLLLIIGNGFLTLLGTLLFAGAISLGYVALTASLAAMQPFFVLVMTGLLGVFYPRILKEDGGHKVFTQKLFAVILMFIGVVLITN